MPGIRGAVFTTFWRHRPKVLTTMVFSMVAAIIALANLTYDEGRVWRCIDVYFSHKSYGWPLIWHRYVAILVSADHRGQIGWYYSAARLAANLAMWAAMLVAPAGVCEWLLRRYRPRLRWSLRTMLVVVGLAAALLAWFAAARERAKLQDSIKSTSSHSVWQTVWFERWGPKWLGLVGADRFRRQIIFARLEVTAGNEDDIRLLKRLRHLPKLRHLELKVDHLTPKIANALSESRQLRSLSIEETGELGDDKHIWHESLAAIGKMTHLEYLHMSEPTVRGADLARLASLANLKSLRVDELLVHTTKSFSHECLKAIGDLSQLEYLELH